MGLILWSSIEQSVTMICICIPVCRPLFKALLHKVRSPNSASTDILRGNGSFKLHSLPRGALAQQQSGAKDGGELGFRAKLTTLSVTTNKDRTTVSECYARGTQVNNGSDEEILILSGDEARHDRSIRVTNEIHVTRA